MRKADHSGESLRVDAFEQLTSRFNEATIVSTHEEYIMKRVAVRELKARLSEYLAQVKAGEEVVVTQRGRAVAKIVPLPSFESLADRLAEMDRQGLVRLGSGRLPDEFLESPRVQDSEGRALSALRAERVEGL